MSSAHVFVTSAIGLILATVCVSGQTPAGGLSIERVFGPEVPTGPYKHPACLTELANGDLYLVYYGGQGEYARDTAVFGSRLAKGGRTWTPPQAIARDPFRSLGNGVVWQAPDGLVWLFYVVRYGETWSTSRIQAKISRDNAATWSDAFMLHEGAGMMVRNRPIVLARRRLSAAHLPRDGQRPRGRRRREHVALPPVSEGVRTVEADRRHPVEEGQHPAGRRRGLARAPDRLLPARRRLRTDHRWLDGARGVHRRRLDLERGTRLHVPEPERGGGFPEACERQPAAGVQRQHDEAHAARRRAFD